MSQYSFKSSGRNIKELDKKIKRNDFIEKEKELPVGIVLPLQRSKKSGDSLFAMTYDINEQTKINLKNLILTRKGEYLGRPDFGTSLIDLYSLSNNENIDQIAMEEIKSVVAAYMPFIELKNFESSYIEPTINNSPYYDIKIYYIFNNIENEINIKLQVSR